jgi:NAD(P)-dependent dehydrogenase (short-subunit alcohol dehydrogenase family)
MTQNTCSRLVGRVAIVTGAGQFIGRSIALRLAAEGADVAVGDIVAERANAVADEIRKMGRKSIALTNNVLLLKEAEAMVKSTIDAFGKVDVLVNNVGGTGGRKQTQFCDSTEDDWDVVIAQSLKSTANCCRAVINHMLGRKYGRIINISSGAGVRGIPGAVAYSAAKAGVIGLTMSLSQEVALRGVRVNAVSPGPTGSAGLEPPELKEKMAVLSGLGRQGKPDDVAAVVALLASDESDFINGQNYVMAGMNP